jgi:DNA-directed RNA polymerase specialized sigma24 family protein
MTLMVSESVARPAAAASLAPDDAALLAAVARGDRAALGALYDRHGGRLLALALRLVSDRDKAEALVHDLFLAVWHQAGSFEPGRTPVQAWLVTRLLANIREACSPAERAQAAQAVRALCVEARSREGGAA